jgi:chromosome segregation ATPase
MQVLMAEVATLRKRVRELEDDCSGITLDSEFDSQEAASLRKALSKVENEKAAMELDFMNQLSKMARENSSKVENLQKQLDERESELKAAKNASPVKAVGISHIASAKDAEIKQLKEDLASADKELEVTRKDMDGLYKKINKLEGQKNALIDEVTGLRLEVDNQTKVITSLNQAMEENDKHFTIRVQKLEAEISQKNTVTSKYKDNFAEMNENVIKLETQRAMLIEEITDLRMQLDREDDSKKAMQKKLEDLEQKNRPKSSSTEYGSLKKAASDAEERILELQETVDSLQSELRSVTKSYKTDVSRLEETVSLKEMECEKAQAELAATEETIQKLKKEARTREKEVREKAEQEKKIYVELEQEVANLKRQRLAYERKTAQSVMNHVSEVDGAKEKIKSLEGEVETLKKNLEGEKKTTSKLKSQLAELKKFPAKKSIFIPTPPLSPTPSPAYTGIRSRPSSPSVKNLRATSPLPVSTASSPANSSLAPDSPSSRTSVKELAACFEGKGGKMTKESDSVGDCTQTTASSSVTLGFSYDTDSLQRQVQKLEKQLQEAKTQNEELQQKIHEKSEEIGELHAEVSTLSATRSAIQNMSRKEYEKQIEQLQSDLVEAHKALEKETQQVEQLKNEIRELTKERLAYEECTMEAYEKRAVTSQKTYQGELNNAKVELTKAQMKLADVEKDYKNQIEQLEKTIEELNVECDKELEEKQGELDVVKYKYEEQMDMVDKLQKEREQLCVQMNSMSNAKREEIEELQADLMEKSTQITSLQRVLQGLQMQVEHQTDNTNELEYLRDRVRELESKDPAPKSVHKQHVEVETLKVENQKLQEQIRGLTLERRSLQEKLKETVTSTNSNGGGSDSRTLQVLRERNEKLRKEVDRLTTKLENFEAKVTRIAI